MVQNLVQFSVAMVVGVMTHHFVTDCIVFGIFAVMFNSSDGPTGVKFNEVSAAHLLHTRQDIKPNTLSVLVPFTHSSVYEDNTVRFLFVSAL